MISKFLFLLRNPVAFILTPIYRMIFKDYGKGSYILKPMAIDNACDISIGIGVIVQQYTWLAAAHHARLIIGDGVRIGHFNHIYSTGMIIIERDVMTADKVYIGDVKHGFEDPEIPIKDQPIENLGKIVIGEGSWIGENSCIIGASIGKHCVIGANSVVTHDVPDYSVALGSPARIIKKYNTATSKWEKIV